MNDGEALLQTILDNPADDDVRLVYSDWLESEGQEARANFIRLQIQLAEATKEKCYCGDSGDPTGCYRCRSIARLWKQTTPLLAANCEQWIGALFPDPIVKINRHYSENNGSLMFYPVFDGTFHSLGICFRRGFADYFEATKADWLRYGKGLGKKTPLDRVVLINQAPWEYDEGWGLSCVLPDEFQHRRPDDLPSTLFWLLQDGKVYGRYIVTGKPESRIYETLEQALTDLSNACIRYAKEEFKDEPQQQ